MTLGVVTRFYDAAPASGWLLRVCIDSVRAYLPRETYETFVAVNDCSRLSPETSAYLREMQRRGVIEIVDADPRAPARAPYYYAHGAFPDPPEMSRSLGPVGALAVGIERLVARGCTHALSLDSDAMLLRPFPQNALELFERLPRVLCVSDYYGGWPDPDPHALTWSDRAGERVVVAGRPRFRALRDRPFFRDAEWHGRPHSSCALIDLRYHTPERREELAAPETGWFYERWYARALDEGWRSAYFPLYRHGYAFHLGYGTLRETHARDRVDQDGGRRRTYGNVPESPAYLGKHERNWWAGYLQTRTSGDEFVRCLGERCAATPADTPVAFAPEDFTCP